MDVLRREFIYIWYYFTVQLEQIFGWWVLGMVVGSAVSVFAKDPIHRAFRSLESKKLGVLGIVAASGLGIASPLCMYGTIPIASSFSKGGMKDSWLAAFMMSSILLNPQLIIYSAALGGMVMTVRIVSCFLCGITAGLLLHFLYKDRSFLNFSGFDEPKSRDTDSNLFMRYIKNLWRNVKATGVYFLIGVLLSALFQRYVPAEAMTALFGGNEALGVLMAATVGGSALCLRRGNNSTAARLAFRRHECWQRRLLYAYRAFYQNYQLRRIKDCLRFQTILFVSRLCGGIFYDRRVNC